MSIRIIDAAIGRSRAVLVTLLLILISGTYAYVTIPKESAPDVDIPLIYVSMFLEGVSPEDAEKLLLRPVEQELASVEGVKEIKSSGYTGGGYVLLEFEAGFDKDKAIEDVQKGVDRVRVDLPQSMDREPDVREVNFSLFPVLVVTLSGDLPERTLLKLMKELQDDIEAIPQVLEANISGDREEVVEVVVDPALIEGYGINGGEVMQFFRRSNRLVAAGVLDTGVGSFSIKVPGLFESIRDVMDMPLKIQGDSSVKVSDIADVRKTFKDAQSFVRINGKRAIALDVVKKTGENIIQTIEDVQKVVEEKQKYWPEGVVVNYTLDQSGHIRSMLSDLQNNIISAVLLVMAVIVLFLGVRPSLLVGIAIPGAFLGGILVIYSMGLSVNVVVLFALILSVGMLVDGAIVVVEYADRKMLEGIDKKRAYSMAARQMAWPIIASTATTLAAFAPLLFWPGLVGQFMRYLPLTLIAVLSASLLMALVFVPVLGVALGGNFAGRKAKKKNEIGLFTSIYIIFLEKALRAPGLVLSIAVILLIGVQLAYGIFGKGIEFFPNVEPEAAKVIIHARGNLSAREKDYLVRQVEDIVLETDGIAVFYTLSGKQPQGGMAELGEDVIGTITLDFDDWQKRKHADDILQEIRNNTAGIAGINVETIKMEEGPPRGKAVQIEVSGRFPDLLEDSVENILSILENVGDLIAIEDSRPMPGIEWELEVDRQQAAKFGVDISIIGDYVRMVTNGLKIAEYRPDDSDDEIDIVIRHSAGKRTINSLDDIRIETKAGSIPISNFVKRKAKPAVGRIDRVGQMRTITVKADLPAGYNVNSKVEEIKKHIESAQKQGIFDPRVKINFIGEAEDQEEAQAFLKKAFVVALFLMAIILVTQFNSFYSAFLVLFAVIMSTIGVMIGLMVTQQPFGIIMSGVGVIALAGIVVNNNIVLIDTFDFLRKSGKYSVREAILRTGRQRLRPVLLTTVTTVLGLIPMVLQISIDFAGFHITHGAPSSQWWVQLSTAVVFGLTFSTILTLVITPCALMLRENIAGFFRK